MPLTPEQGQMLIERCSKNRRGIKSNETHHHTAGLRPAISQPIERPALVTPSAGEEPRQGRPERCHLHRYRITYTVYAVRPMDFDNIAVKKIQDELVHQNFLPDDNWKVLEGTVISKKAAKESDERTVIEIEPMK